LLIHLYPNAEIEIVSNFSSPKRKSDSHRIRPKLNLDIRLPVHTERLARLKSGLVAGFGKLHKGKGNFRRGTARRIQRLGGTLDFLAAKNGHTRAFITLTCPGSTKRAIEKFSAWTGYLLDSLNKWIAAKQQRFSGEQGVARLHCWELQKRGAEHLHYVVNLSPQVFEVVKEELRQWYHAILERICELSGEDIFARSNGGGSWRGFPGILQVKCEEVTKSVSAYLSKYLRKGLKVPLAQSFRSSTPRPARLWGASKLLKVELSRCTISRFCNFGRETTNRVYSAFQALLETKELRFSSHSWNFGLSQRTRSFFGGSEYSQSEIWESLSAILEGCEEKENDRIPKGDETMGRLLRKGFRLWEDTRKRTAFSNTYGDWLGLILANWCRTLPVTKLELTYLLRALEDFDEVSLKSSSNIPTSKTKNKTKQSQLQLHFWPPATPE
jgi:hypothetical protein